jgi:hypothetical protein
MVERVPLLAPSTSLTPGALSPPRRRAGDHARPDLASSSPARSSRASTAIISRDVNRSWSRPSFPSATSSGWRAPPHHLVELLLAVAVTEREHGKVAGGERRLLPRDPSSAIADRR